MAGELSDEEAAMSGALPGERPSTADLVRSEWYVAVSDDHVYFKPEMYSPGEHIVRRHADELQMGWPGLAAGSTPVKAFMHPSFNYPRWPFSVYKVSPTDTKLRLEKTSQGDAWLRGSSWKVITTVPEQEIFGANGEHVINLFENLSGHGPTLDEEQAKEILNRMTGRLMRAGAIYEGPLRTRVIGLYKDLATMADQRGLHEERLIAEGVAAHFAGTFGFTESPLLFDLAAVWALVLGDTVENPLAELPDLVAGGIIPRSVEPNRLTFNWSRPKPEAQAAQAQGIAALLAKDELDDSDMDWLNGIEQRMSSRLVGHAENISDFAQMVRNKALGLMEPQEPVSVVALGPSGNGKTEFFRTAAEALFGDEDQMEVLDMSDFMDKSDAARLAGAPPRYVGYDDGSPLLNAVKKFSTLDEKTKTWAVNGVLLLDELDKAHPDIYNVLLGILTTGRYKLANGETLDFTKAVIGHTGNFGTSDMKIATPVGFAVNRVEAPSRETLTDLGAEIVKGLREKATTAWETATKPELRNRVKLTMHFDPLGRDELSLLAERKLTGVLRRAAERHKLEITYEPEVIEALVNHKIDRLKGGRAVVDNILELVDPKITAKVTAREKGRFRLVAGADGIGLVPELKVVGPERAGTDDGLSLAG